MVESKNVENNKDTNYKTNPYLIERKKPCYIVSPQEKWRQKQINIFYKSGRPIFQNEYLRNLEYFALRKFVKYSCNVNFDFQN